MFRRREGRGSDNNNETRMAKNLTKNPITLGDIDNLELLPGRNTDLLKHASIQRIGSSTDLRTAVRAGWVRLKNRDNRVVSRTSVKTAIIPAILDDTEKIERTNDGDIIANELIRDVRTVSGDYTAVAGDDIILVSVTATVTLPTAVGLQGYHFVIKSIGNGITVTIDTTGNETIDGQDSQIITIQYNSLTCVSNGTNWFVV